MLNTHTTLVTVLVLTYNHRRFIRECINSILAQQCSFSFEIIIYDDASTDGTNVIISDLAQRHPQIIFPILAVENLHSRGVSPRKQLLKEAKSKYIAHCDGDDFWANSNKLQAQVDFLERNHDHVMCFHDATVINEFGNIISKRYFPDSFKRDYDKNQLSRFEYQHILFGTILHRNVPLNFPGEFDLIKNRDNLFPALFAEYGGAKFLEAAGPLYYRHHSESSFANKGEVDRFTEDFRTRLILSSYYISRATPSASNDLIVNYLIPMISRWQQVVAANETRLTK